MSEKYRGPLAKPLPPPKKKQWRANPVSTKQRELLLEEQRLKKEFLAKPENRWCPVAIALIGRARRTTDHHHMRGKGFPALRLDTRFWRAVSRWGHDWIDRNREEARKRGWLCARGEWNTLPK